MNDRYLAVADDGPSYFYIAYFVVIHVVGVIGIWYAFAQASTAVIWLAIAYFFACHLAITIAAHRYYTHGALQMTSWLEYVFLLLLSGVAQGAIVWWVGKHLQHHAYEDIPGMDPHTPKDGFFHSHMGWLLKRSGWSIPDRRFIGKFYKGRTDKYRALMWQSDNRQWLIPLMTFGVPITLGFFAGDWLGGLLVIGFARLLIQYHATWVVNSVGHTLGESTDNIATNFGWYLYTPVAAILTVGEAWHANHHQSSAHWRLGRKWWQIDLGAYMIWLLNKMGLVWDLKEPDNRRRVPTV